MITSKFVIIFTFALNAGQGSLNYPSYEDDIIRYRKAENIRKYLNQTVDPCVNFYEFACGNWPTYHPANSTFVETNPLTELRSEKNRELKQMFADYHVNDTATDRKLKDFYQSCMNLPQMKSVYGSKLRELVKEFGQMPVLEGQMWQEAQFDWMETVAKIYHQYDIAIFLSYSLYEKQRVAIGHPELGITTELNVAYNLFTLFGIDKALADRTAKELLDFESALAAGAANNTAPEGEQPKATSIKKIQAKYAPDLDVKKFLQIAVGRIPSGEIFERNEAFNAKLVEVLRSTPKRVVANYVFYFLVKPFIMFIPKSQKALANNCVVTTKQYFPEAVDNLIYRRTDTRATEQALSNLFYDLKSMFKSHLNSDRYHWMGRSTRRDAVNKLNGLEIIFNSFADMDFDKKYTRVTMNNNDYVANIKSLLSEKAFKSRSNTDQLQTSEVSNLMYFIHTNNVHVAIQTLQPHYLWSPAYPTAVNFGVLGTVLAHEIVHALDGDSIEFDENGEESNWFDAKSRKAFDERVQCLKDQFGNYTYFGKPLPEMHSQDENIADGGGMRLLYDVYSNWRNGAWRPQSPINSEILPLLHYSPEQLLFISYAQLWCTDITPAYRESKQDSHAPASLRVTATLSNLKEFSSAFLCPEGSAMNPKEKCEIY